MSQLLQVHVSRRGEDLGVYSVNKVFTLLRERALQPSDLYWYKGMGKPEPIWGQKINVNYAFLSHFGYRLSLKTTFPRRLTDAYIWDSSSILGAPLLGHELQANEDFHNAHFLCVPAQVELAQRYAELIGELGVAGDVHEDENRSSMLQLSDHMVPWLKNTAELGDWLAQYELFHSYKNGLGVVMNDAKAEHWLRQYIVNTITFPHKTRRLTAIADIYEEGRIVKQDLVIAYLLYALEDAEHQIHPCDGDTNFDSMYDLEKRLSIDDVFTAHTIKEEILQRLRHQGFSCRGKAGVDDADLCPYCAGEINEVTRARSQALDLMCRKGHVKSLLINAKIDMEHAATLEGEERSRKLLNAFFRSKVASILGRRRFLEQGASVSLGGKNGVSDELLDANVNISTLDRDLVMHPSYNVQHRRAETAASEIMNGYNPENLTRPFLESGKYRSYPWGNGTYA